MTPPDLAPMYQLERQLARTPFGNAWSARAADDARVMVVVLAPELCTLVREPARLLAALRARVVAPGVVAPGVAATPGDDAILLPLLDVIDGPDERVALVLPLEERANAAARLGTERTFPTSELSVAAHAIGLAMQRAHAAGTTLGALCPGTLYLGDGLAPRVLAHGWVDAFAEAGAERATVLSAIGARTFAAPEITSTIDPGPMTPAADLYALGATLYACMTGRPPFGGRTTATVMAAVLADETLLSGEMPRAPRDVAAVEQAAATERLTHALLRAVERAPADRWSTAGDFVQALAPRIATPPRAVPATPMRVGRTGLVVLVVLLAAIAAGLIALR